jgi:hypothetical protein
MWLLIVRGALIGALATATMDLLTTTAAKLGWVALLPRGLIGRWFASVGRGEIVVRDIGQSRPVKHETGIAESVHYAIGIVLGLAYVLASSMLRLSPRSFLPALGFGLCTNAFPWFLMFPAMGYGWFGSRGPKGTRLFAGSLVAHCFYGVGLWLGALILS